MLLFDFARPFNRLANASLAFILFGPTSGNANVLTFIFISIIAVLLLSIASSNAYRSVEASLIEFFEYAFILMGVSA